MLAGLLLTGCAGPEPVPTATAAPSPSPTPTPLTEIVYPAGERLAMDELCAALGFDFEATETGAIIEGKALELYPELETVCFDGRYIYAPGGFEAGEDGLLMEPEATARMLGLGLEAGGELIYLDASAPKLLPGGDDYYDIHFDMDMLYWLPRIIRAEAFQQPMAGQIAVGNVVMNRVDSPKFPMDIAGVIYDMDYAIQFDPVADGSIKIEPDETAEIAARLCLEGYNTAGDSLFFVNPERGDGSWFAKELELVAVIGEHWFYRYK